MLLRMYNVGFGDCFLLRDGSDGLLVDFGSDTPEVLPAVAKDIISSKEIKSLSVLLTHFHRDHINGIWETDLVRSKAIDKVYIPDVFRIRARHNRLTFAQLDVLSGILSSLVVQKRPLEITLYTLLKSLTGLGGCVEFLARGNTFPVAGTDYQVLWPSLDDLRIHKKTEDAVIETLVKLEFLDPSAKREDLLGQEIPGEPVVLEPIDRFIGSLRKAYEALTMADGPRSDLMGAVEASYREMEAYVLERPLQMTEELRGELESRVKSIRGQANQMSIVFQAPPQSGISKFLMTGDVTPPCLKKIIANKGIRHCRFPMGDEYGLIKAPHHGTKTHYYNGLPKCDAFLISNGETPLPNRGKIFESYGGIYASGIKCALFCTNPRCELYEHPLASNCPTCSGPRRPHYDHPL